MKKTVTTLLIAMLATAGIFAQNTSYEDTTKIVLGKTKVLVLEIKDAEKDSLRMSGEDHEKSAGHIKSELTHWAGIDLGVNTLFNAGGQNAAPDDASWFEIDEARSLSWNINFYEEKIKLIGNHVGILTGLGLTYNSYGIKTNSRIRANNDSTYAQNVPDSLYTFDKNKLRATYLRVPLMLEFNTSEKPKRSAHLAVGVIGGLRIGSITKQHYEVDGQKYRDRIKDDFNLNSFTLDAAVRLGFSNFTLWANYGLMPLFDKDKGPEVYALSAGITLLPF